jgi:hypothetical protein
MIIDGITPIIIFDYTDLRKITLIILAGLHRFWEDYTDFQKGFLRIVFVGMAGDR